MFDIGIPYSSSNCTYTTCKTSIKNPQNGDMAVDPIKGTVQIFDGSGWTYVSQINETDWMNIVLRIDVLNNDYLVLLPSIKDIPSPDDINKHEIIKRAGWKDTFEFIDYIRRYSSFPFEGYLPTKP